MSMVYTIGYQGKALAKFVGQLCQSNVDAVIDVRLRNTSQLAGYTKRDNLAFLLKEGFGIAYEHHPELAPDEGILDAYKADHDWAAYEAHFLPLMRERGAEDVGSLILARFRAPCLLCAEAKPDQCHRRLVAEHWAERLPDVSVVHL